MEVNWWWFWCAMSKRREIVESKSSYKSNRVIEFLLHREGSAGEQEDVD